MRFLVDTVESANRVEGRLLSGKLSRGDSIAILPSGQQSSLLTIHKLNQQPASVEAEPEAKLTLDLSYSVTIAAGSLIAPADDRPEYSDQFEAKIHCIGEVN